MANPSITFESLIDEQDRLFIAMESLNQVAQAAVESIDSGGLIGQSYPYLRTVVDDAATLAGVRQRTVPSLESFGGKHTRVTSTLVSVEGIKEVMKKIWEMIVRTFERVAGWFKNYLVGVNTRHSANLRRLEKCRKDLETAGDLIKSEKIEHRSQYINLKTLEAHAFSHVAKEMTRLVEEAIPFEKESTADFEAVVEALTVDFVKSGDLNALKMVLAKSKVPSNLPRVFKKDTRILPGAKYADMRTRYTSFEQLPYLNVYIDLIVLSWENGGYSVSAELKRNAYPQLMVELPVWSKQQLKEICKDVETLLKEIEKLIDVLTVRMKSLADRPLSELERGLAKNLADFEEGAGGLTDSNRNEVVRDALRRVNDTSLQIHRLGSLVAGELLELIEKGLGRYT